jgi:hypothetical protein
MLIILQDFEKFIFSDNWLMVEIYKRFKGIKVDEKNDNDLVNTVTKCRSKIFDPKYPWLEVVQRGEEII